MKRLIAAALSLSFFAITAIAIAARVRETMRRICARMACPRRPA